MMTRLHDLYPSTRFFCIGFSMGGNIITRMIAKLSSDGLQHRIIAGLSVAQGYCAKSLVLVISFIQHFLLMIVLFAIVLF